MVNIVTKKFNKICNDLARGYRLFKRYFYLKIKYSVYSLLEKRIGVYQDIDGDYKKIGFIDHDGLIHCDEKYHNYFSKDNLYTGGDYINRKKFEISLIYYMGEILVEKNYKNKNFSFYNEMCVLNILKDLDFIPSIKFVSYKEKVIYIEMVSGYVLREKLAQQGALLRDIDIQKQNIAMAFDEKAQEGKKLIDSILNSEIKLKILESINIIHERKIIIHDIKYGNIIINNEDIYLIDFETSISFPEIPRVLFKYFKNIDNKKIGLLFPI